MGKTKIEWCDESWNPLSGCSAVSDGCRYCYAERMAHRLKGRHGYPGEKPFAVTFHRDKLKEPRHWRKARRVFAVSMGDIFHDEISDGLIMWLFWEMAHNWNQTFLVLTKRPRRMLDWFEKWSNAFEEGDFDPRLAKGPDAIRKAHKARRAHLFADMLDLWGEPPEGCGFPFYDWMEGIVTWPRTFANIHLGVSVENQKAADERIPLLLKTPASVRFVSCEPLLGFVNLEKIDGREFEFDVISALVKSGPRRNTIRQFPALDGVLAGGETGPGARPMHPTWIRSLRDQCLEYDTPFFFKQWGNWQNGSDFKGKPDRNHIVLTDGTHGRNAEAMGYDAGNAREWHALEPKHMSRVGKKRAGRILDGRTWDDLPKKRISLDG